MSARFRALTRVAAFAVLVFVLFPSKRIWLAKLIPGLHGAVGYVVEHMMELAAILIAGAIMARIERRPFGEYGLPFTQAFRARFWQGAVGGIAALTLLVFALAGVGALQMTPPSTLSVQAAVPFLGYAVVFVLLAVREEFLYRGLGLVLLGEAVTFWPAALASTVWFAGSHAGNANENAIGLANLAVFGLLACFTLKRTGNLWLAVGYHAAWDWGETYLFGVGDSGHPPAPGHLFTSLVPSSSPSWLSGGSVGPEGSVLCLPLFLVLWVVCVRFLPSHARDSQPTLPMKRRPSA